MFVRRRNFRPIQHKMSLNKFQTRKGCKIKKKEDFRTSKGYLVTYLLFNTSISIFTYNIHIDVKGVLKVHASPCAA